ncbi:MAG: hypothetical protein RLZZ618_3781, partial [Pseudomonadota bacterium]
AGEVDVELSTWWERFSLADEATRTELVAQARTQDNARRGATGGAKKPAGAHAAPVAVESDDDEGDDDTSSPVSADPVRKKRRRRRKPAGGGGGGGGEGAARKVESPDPRDVRDETPPTRRDLS